MSGVLDRMVQRSRGQLPAVEPLVRAQQTAAAALPFVVEESSAVATRRGHAAQARQPHARREESTAPADDSMRSNADQARELTRKEPRGSEALDVAGPSNTAEPGERAETNDETVDGLKKSPRPVAAGKALQENAESRESSLDIHSDKLAAGANREETASEEIHAKPEPNELEAKRDAIAERSEAGNPAPAFEVGDHTEIHITIGSVELRAPRVAPVPPRSPAFRPRVTLDEFLKRGSGPGGRGARP